MRKQNEALAAIEDRESWRNEYPYEADDKRAIAELRAWRRVLVACGRYVFGDDGTSWNRLHSAILKAREVEARRAK